MKLLFKLIIFTIFSSCQFVEKPLNQQSTLNDLSISSINNDRLLLINGLSLDWQIIENGKLGSNISLPNSGLPCLSPNALKPYKDFFYLVCSLSQEILVLRKNNLSIAKVITLPNLTNPWDIEFINDHLAVVTSFQQNAIFLIDHSPENIPNRLVKKISISTSGAYSRPHGLVKFQNKIFIALANLNDNFVGIKNGAIAVFNTESLELESTIESSAPNTTQVKIGPDNLLYVINTGSYDLNSGGYVGDGSIDLIDPLELKNIGKIKIAGAPLDLVFSPENSLAFVTNGLKGDLFVYNYPEMTQLKSINLTPSPCGIQNPDQMSFISSIATTSSSIFLTEFNSNCLIELDLSSQVIKSTQKSGIGPSILLNF